MTETKELSITERWIMVIIVMVITFTLSWRVSDQMAVFVAWMELLGIGFGWYFRDKATVTT